MEACPSVLLSNLGLAVRNPKQNNDLFIGTCIKLYFRELGGDSLKNKQNKKSFLESLVPFLGIWFHACIHNLTAALELV